MRGQRIRIYFSETDRFEGKRLSDTLIHRAMEHRLKGATLFRGLMGFGSRGMRNASILRLSESLPVVLEIVDAIEPSEAFLKDIIQLAPHVLITREEVEILDLRALVPQT
ncbi:hypothetical protein TDMWS_21020 [Thermodesulfomicrobium sp. WS]|uniref:DUF190 domain-containing protein n=1 Tax=Thermodesulfomicrobium sp. WS TaxID=3004129 RepID=UPI002491FD95|nr:DUF190 domain-containing protein [Thermodesulfomicrobium sp. WS]BDV02017.1 hypothetical protein TDMWS_21020 [Thermodesulfomicrobium sp. WS]